MGKKWELKEISLSDSTTPLFVLFIKREPFDSLDDLVETCKFRFEEDGYARVINSFTYRVSEPYPIGIGSMGSRGWNSFYLVEERENINIINPKTLQKQHVSLGPYLIYSLYTYGARGNFLKSDKEKERAFKRLFKDTKSFYKIVNILDKEGFDRTKEIPNLIGIIVNKHIPKESWVYYLNSPTGKAWLVHYPKGEKPFPEEFSKTKFIDVLT